MQSENNKKIALIHNNLNVAAGTEKCVFTAIEALNEKGIIPDVFAIQDASAIEVKNNFGKSVRYNFKGIKYLKHLKHLKGFEIYKYPLINLLTAMTAKLSQYDYIFNFTPSCIFVPDRKNYVLYIHFPDRGYLEHSEKYKSGLWKLYPIPISMLSRISKLGEKITIACNSQFTKSTLLRYYKVDKNKIHIIYPPVEIESEATEHIIKKDEITTIGRFTSVKRQMEQIEIASLFPELKFNIIGSTYFSDAYFRQCQKYVDKNNNIKNVNLYPNLDRKKLMTILKNSKYFMHNMRDEHFGISTVEAIDKGCIPIVHNSGGQKEVVPFRELRFDDKDEAVKIIRNWQNKKDDNHEMIIKLKENIKKFSAEKYKQDILGLING